MFKQVKLSVLIIGTIITTKSNAQISYFGNTGGTAGNYVGWANTEAFPLQIRHNANQPINFFTNNTERMRLTQTGFLGIGITNPLSHLHLNISSANEVFSRFSNTLTGNSANDGFKIGILDSGEVQLYQYEAKPITFHTFKTQRVIITAGGFVGIGTPSPSNMLHVNNIYNGRLFRTDGANANTNYWQFFTNNVEKFRLSVLANDSNVTLNVIQNKSMIFNTNNTTA